MQDPESVARDRAKIIEYLKAQPTASVWELFANCTDNPFALAYEELRRSGELSILRGERAFVRSWSQNGTAEGVFNGIVQHPQGVDAVAQIDDRLYSLPRNLQMALEQVSIGQRIRVEHVGPWTPGERKNFTVRIVGAK
jgi:hypothetical protein